MAHNQSESEIPVLGDLVSEFDTILCRIRQIRLSPQVTADALGGKKWESLAQDYPELHCVAHGKRKATCASKIRGFVRL